ncbi:MAG: M48 family metallopeptidase [Acidobacteriota bacterium]
MPDKQIIDIEDYRHAEEASTFARVSQHPIVVKLISAIDSVQHKLLKGFKLGKMVRVARKQFPVLHATLTSHCRLLGIEPPTIYVSNHPVMNAYTNGLQADEETFIVLHSSLLDTATSEQMSSIIGHELGHIKSNHRLYRILMMLLFGQATSLLAQLPDLLRIPLALSAKTLLMRYVRACEYSCDALGYCLCADITAAVKAELLLSAGSQTLASQVNMAEFLKQADELDRAELLSKAGMMLMAEQITHPFGPHRVRELIRFASRQRTKELLAWRRQRAA